MARKKLGDFTELQDLTQVSERVPKDTDRIAITRFGRNLNMCVSTLIEYINERLTQGGSVSEELSLIRESIVDLQNQIDVLTETDLSELLSKLNDIKDFLDVFGEEENLSEILATLQSAIMSDVENTYVTKEDFNDHVDEQGDLNNLFMGNLPSLITFDEYRAIQPKEYKYYHVAKDATDKERGKTWRIYLRTQLVGEFNVDGSLTLPKFPMRFPFRLA